MSEATVENEDQNTACGLGAQTLVLENSLDAPHREAGFSVLPLSCWLVGEGAIGQDKLK